MHGDENLRPDELMHYGRLGMKWGRHIYGQVKTARTNKKRKQNLAKARKAKIEKQKSAAERQKALDSGKIKAKDMTDAELKARTARLQAEKQYNDLMRDTKTVNKGKTFIKSAAMGPGKKIFFDTSVDLAAQTFKAVGADEINKHMRKYGFEGEIVFANNKRK